MPASINIKILGIGGALNVGLPYNSFLLNDTVLCETPPDIMLSLQQNQVDLASIRSVYVSHLHGDHTFGLPFLILSAWFLHFRYLRELSFTIIGPKGIEDLTKELLIRAFTADHPCFGWMKIFCSFSEIDESSRPVLIPSWETALFRLNHMVETYGFSLSKPDSKMAFAYVADTMWCEAIPNVLNHSPEIVLIDLNGQEDEPNPVHLSVAELQAKALPLTGDGTQYYGTHVKEIFHSSIACIKCARPGMVIPLSGSA
jgi:phosphoribosyl 1,2-cyclic phosphodiesterase